MIHEIKLPKRKIKLKSDGQKQYVEAIMSSDLTFAFGPAGTGKTFLAVACALDALISQKVQRIILVRPAVEAGEKLGFLPGDMSEKVNPYLRPVYDALLELLGSEARQTYLSKGEVEVAPLAFMRGRTFSDSFIICDEAQNATKQQMQMFLTRLGFGSKMVVVGDTTQIDLQNQESGLADAIHRLKGIEGISLVELTKLDIRRHPLVQRIVDAYDPKVHKELTRFAQALSSASIASPT